MVYTQSDWYLFLNYYKEQIPWYEGIRVIDATEGGARIAHTEVMTLADAIRELCIKEYPLEEWISRVPKVQVNGAEMLATCIEQTKKSERRLEELIKTGSKLRVLIKCGKTQSGEFSRQCQRYDTGYYEMIDGADAAVLRRYSEAALQKYIEEAMLAEGDPVKRFELETDLFQSMLENGKELSDYMTEIQAIN